MTPQQAYEKRYSRPWSEAAQGVQNLWLAAWTIAWVMAEHDEREACAKLAENYCGAWDDHGQALVSAIRSRSAT